MGKLPRKVALAATADPLRLWDTLNQLSYIEGATAFDRELDAIAAYGKLLRQEVEARGSLINVLEERNHELTQVVNPRELRGMLLVHGYDVPLVYITNNWSREDALEVRCWALLKDATTPIPEQLKPFNKL